MRYQTITQPHLSFFTFYMFFTSRPRTLLNVASLTRHYAAPAGTRPLIARYTDVVPVELARVQSGRNVRLRDYETQVKLKRFSYDLKLQDGKVLPAKGDNFIGASLHTPVFLAQVNSTFFFRSKWMLPA